MTEIYSVSGLALDSELPLPELPTISCDSGRLVRIRLGPATQIATFSCKIDADTALVSIPGIAEYSVEGPASVQIRPDPHSSAQALRQHLLGFVRGLLCYRHGLLPIHASVPHRDGVAVMISAPSGGGKSTLAAHLVRDGFCLMEDDIAAIDPDRAWVSAGATGIRLQPEAQRLLGLDGGEPSDDGKHRFLQPNLIGRLPVAALYLLEDGPAGIEPIPADQLLMSLWRALYRPSLVLPMGEGGRVMRRCLALATQLGVYRLSRPKTALGLSAAARLLNLHRAAGFPSQSFR